MGTPINIGSQSASLGSALGQALGGGLQQLAANRLQRLQQQQQVGSLANLLGGNQQLAADILSQPTDIQKQIFASQGFANLMGGAQGMPQAEGMPNQAMGGLFTPAEKPLTAYQRGQQELAQKTLEQKEKIAGFKEQRELRKEQEIVYDKNIAPLLKERDNARSANRRLASLSDKAKQITTTDRLIEGLPEGIIKDYATLLQSPAAIGAKKDQASFIRGVNDVIKGKLTNYEAKIWLDQFPNILTTSVTASRDVINSLIWLNNLAIKKADIADKIYQENPSIRRDELQRQIDKEVENFLQNDPSFKKKSSLDVQAAQPKTLQPEQPQEQAQFPQEQPQQQVELPQEQPQEAPLQTEQMPENALDFLRESIEPVGQGLQFQVNTAAQVLKPLITRFGGNVTKIAEYVQEKFGEGNISAISKLAQKLIPDEQQAQEYLKQMGVPEEELENPSKLVTGLQTAGVGIPLAISTIANPFGTIALIAAKGILSTVAPKLAGFATSLAGGEEKAQQAAEGATQILTDLLPLDFTKRAGKARKINELTKNEIEKITKGSTKQILDNKDTISNIKKTKQNDTNNLKLKADEQIAELQTKIRNVGISRKDYQKKIGSLYENIADLNKENAKLNLEDVDREILYEKLLNVRDDAYFPDKTKINQLIQKYQPRKTEDVETGLLGATGKPITTTKTSGESRTLGDLFEDIKNLFALAKGSKRGSPIYEARETAKALAEKNASPEFITAKKDIDAQYTAASKALDPLEIKRSQNAFRDQIKNIKLNTKKQVDEIANNATQQIDSLDKLNNILTATQKLDKSSVGKNGVSATDIFTALVNPKYYAGSKAYKAAKGVFTLQPETEERLIFLKEYFPAAFNKIEQAAEAASQSLLQANKEAADKASKLFLDAVNKGNKLLNKFYK